MNPVETALKGEEVALAALQAARRNAESVAERRSTLVAQVATAKVARAEAEEAIRNASRAGAPKATRSTLRDALDDAEVLVLDTSKALAEADAESATAARELDLAIQRYDAAVVDRCEAQLHALQAAFWARLDAAVAEGEAEHSRAVDLVLERARHGGLSGSPATRTLLLLPADLGSALRDRYLMAGHRWAEQRLAIKRTQSKPPAAES